MVVVVRVHWLWRLGFLGSWGPIHWVGHARWKLLGCGVKEVYQ